MTDQDRFDGSVRPRVLFHVAACAGSGLVLMVVAALGVVGVGPFAAG